MAWWQWWGRPGGHIFPLPLLSLYTDWYLDPDAQHPVLCSFQNGDWRGEGRVGLPSILLHGNNNVLYLLAFTSADAKKVREERGLKSVSVKKPSPVWGGQQRELVFMFNCERNGTKDGLLISSSSLLVLADVFWDWGTALLRTPQVVQWISLAFL